MTGRDQPGAFAATKAYKRIVSLLKQKNAESTYVDLYLFGHLSDQQGRHQDYPRDLLLSLSLSAIRKLQHAACLSSRFQQHLPDRGFQRHRDLMQRPSLVLSISG